MGGGVSIPVPVSATRQAELAKKYEAELSAGKDDAACAELLKANLPGILVYDQARFRAIAPERERETMMMMMTAPIAALRALPPPPLAAVA